MFFFFFEKFWQRKRWDLVCLKHFLMKQVLFFFLFSEATKKFQVIGKAFPSQKFLQLELSKSDGQIKRLVCIRMGESEEQLSESDGQVKR
jgi:hypothetical protein